MKRWKDEKLKEEFQEAICNDVIRATENKIGIKLEGKMARMCLLFCFTFRYNTQFYVKWTHLAIRE